MSYYILNRDSYLPTSLLFCILFLLILPTQNTYSQESEWKMYERAKTISYLAQDSNYIWVGTEDGIELVNKIDNQETSHLNIMPKLKAFIEDSLGNKWIGGDSLIKYKGAVLKTYNISNYGLAGNVKNLEILNDTLWVCTDNGLCFLVDTVWKTYDTRRYNILSNNISCIIMDKTGKKWIGTDKGISLFDGTKWDSFTMSNSALPNNDITSMSVDKAGNIWIGTKGGIAKYSFGVWLIYTSNNSILTNDYIASLSIDHNDIKWFGTPLGMIKYDDNTWSIIPIPNVLFKTATHFLFENGNLWVTTGRSLNKFDGEKWDLFFSGLPQWKVIDITQNSNGIIFVSTTPIYWDEGISDIVTAYDGKTWKTCTFLPSKFIPDKKGNLWFLQNGMLIKYNGETIIPQNIIGNNLLIDNNDNIWLSSSQNGIYIGIDSVWFNYNMENSTIPSNNAKILSVNNHGGAWLTTDLPGLTYFDGAIFTTYMYSDSGLLDNKVTALAIDHNNVVWVGTSYGLSSLDSKKWNGYTTLNSGLPSDEIKNIVVDSINNKWIVTSSGLCKYKDDVWLNSSNSDIPHEIDWPRLIDKKNNIWFGTTKYDGNSWEAMKPPGYGWPGSTPIPYLCDNNNNVWFGTSGGIAVYEGDALLGVAASLDESLVDFDLFQNYPNPYNPITHIEFVLEKSGYTSLKVYDILGNEVETIIDGYADAGKHRFNYNCSKLASGIYIYSLIVNNQRISKKMVVLK